MIGNMKALSFSRRSGQWTVLFQRSLPLCVLMLFLTGCPAPTSPADSTAASGNKLVLRGSNTIGEELAPRLIAAYTNEHSDAVFDTEFKGTGYGLGALSTYSCDIAAASRVVSTNELDLLKQGNIDLNEYVIGDYAVAVVVHALNPVNDLTKEQVRDIFTGTIQNWKEVGGPDQPIHLYIRNPVSGTYLGFQELAMGNGPYGHAQKTLTSYADIVQSISQDPAGIGYSGLPKPQVVDTKMVSIGGVEPTAANVSKGSYPYARVLRLYTDKAKESPAAKEFIQFAMSAKGREIITKSGFVPQQ